MAGWGLAARFIADEERSSVGTATRYVAAYQRSGGVLLCGSAEGCGARAAVLGACAGCGTAECVSCAYAWTGRPALSLIVTRPDSGCPPFFYCRVCNCQEQGRGLPWSRGCSCTCGAAAGAAGQCHVCNTKSPTAHTVDSFAKCTRFSVLIYGHTAGLQVTLGQSIRAAYGTGLFTPEKVQQPHYKMFQVVAE